ncbi:MAG TPA: ribokinase, partial [Pasteurellaceae bacterium]|nr:ribokinase [Pasteurellaceae bacterium]
SNKENAENLIAVDPGANFTITQEEIETILPILSKCNILLVQLENNLNAVEYLISQSYKQGIKIILNPAPYQKISSEMISKVNIITPNEIEAELMTGIKITTIDDAYNASQILHKQGVENVIITLGNKGAYLSSTDGQFHIPPYPAIPVDTTGAGDAFNGALLAELSHGVKLIDACLFANAYASCAVEQKGTAFAMPVRKIVVEKMKTYSVQPIRF